MSIVFDHGFSWFEVVFKPTYSIPFLGMGDKATLRSVFKVFTRVPAGGFDPQLFVGFKFVVCLVVCLTFENKFGYRPEIQEWSGRKSQIVRIIEHTTQELPSNHRRKKEVNLEKQTVVAQNT